MWPSTTQSERASGKGGGRWGAKEKERVSAGETEEERTLREQRVKKEKRRKRDAAQQAEGKVSAPTEENVL